jgi:hypothetical protein
VQKVRKSHAMGQKSVAAKDNGGIAAAVEAILRALRRL